MLDQISISELLMVLSDYQQEFLVGSTDMGQSNTNYTETLVASLESSAVTPLSQNTFSLNLDKAINTAAQQISTLARVIALSPPRKL